MPTLRLLKRKLSATNRIVLHSMLHNRPKVRAAPRPSLWRCDKKKLTLQRLLHGKYPPACSNLSLMISWHDSSAWCMLRSEQFEAVAQQGWHVDLEMRIPIWLECPDVFLLRSCIITCDQCSQTRHLTRYSQICSEPAMKCRISTSLLSYLLPSCTSVYHVFHRFIETHQKLECNLVHDIVLKVLLFWMIDRAKPIGIQFDFNFRAHRFDSS